MRGNFSHRKIRGSFLVEYFLVNFLLPTLHILDWKIGDSSQVVAILGMSK